MTSIARTYFASRRVAYAAGALLALVATSASAETTPTAPATSCFWSEPVVLESLNIGYPDTGSIYYFNNFTLPAGARVIFRGKYPHARYFSFNSYFPVSGATKGVPSDSVSDVQMVPDDGSWNPFLPGAKRTANPGTWTMTVNGLTPPTSGVRDPNTLYAGTSGAGSAQAVQIILRVYVPDKNRDLAGDGGVPDGELVLPDGTSMSGQAACDALALNTQTPTPTSFTQAQYDGLTHLPPNAAKGYAGSDIHSPAMLAAPWYASFNGCHLQDAFADNAGYPNSRNYLASPSGAVACPNTRAVINWANKDNQYISTYLDRRFGPVADGHNIAVLRGKMPVVPATLQRTPFVPGGTEMRYWSLCQTESLVTTETVNCLYDEQVPVSARGDFTIVISTAEDRPANATTRCGAQWMEWSPQGEGEIGNAPIAKPSTRPFLTRLLLRNMLPEASFPYSIQNVPTPGLPAQVAATMGEYVPTVTYQSRADFEAQGCSASGK